MDVTSLENIKLIIIAATPAVVALATMVANLRGNKATVNQLNDSNKTFKLETGNIREVRKLQVETQVQVTQVNNRIDYLEDQNNKLMAEIYRLRKDLGLKE